MSKKMVSNNTFIPSSQAGAEASYIPQDAGGGQSFTPSQVEARISHTAIPTPMYLLRSRNPLIRGILQEWEVGGLSWDEALLTIIAELEKENHRLMEVALQHHQLSPEPVVVTIKEPPDA